MKATLREWIHALNILEEDKDIYVSGIDSIAVVASCHGVKITPEGEKQWGKVLDGAYVEDCYIENKTKSSWKFLASLAGYCPASDYEKWFEGDNAKLI